MEQDQWAPLMRLQEQYRAAHDQGTRDTLDAAMTREVNAIVKGRAVRGTLDTMRDNLRRLDRSRGRLERMATPLMAPANDPWPELDRRIQRDAVVDALKPKTRRTLDLFMRGFTYEEAAELMDEPIGTLKSRVSRAKGGIRRQV